MFSARRSPSNCDWKARPLIHPRYDGEVTKAAWRSREPTTWTGSPKGERMGTSEWSQREAVRHRPRLKAESVGTGESINFSAMLVRVCRPSIAAINHGS
jgi:hypothetical protein